MAKNSGHILRVSRFLLIGGGTGVAKTFEHLLRELADGESTLVVRDHAGAQRLVRTIRPVLLRISSVRPGGNKEVVLVESRRVFRDGRDATRSLSASIAEKRGNSETPESAICRALAEELSVTFSAEELTTIIQLPPSRPRIGESTSFPGILTELDELYYELAMPKRHFREQYIEEQEDKTTFFSWVPWDERPWKWPTAYYT